MNYYHQRMTAHFTLDVNHHLYLIEQVLWDQRSGDTDQDVLDLHALHDLFEDWDLHIFDAVRPY